MNDLPDNYNIHQAHEDILYLGERIKAIEIALGEWSEFMTAEMIKHNYDKRHMINRYFKQSVTENWKQIYEKFEDVYAKLNKLYNTRVGNYD